MKIGSHNSFTYQPARRWWMKPFAFMARCQREGLVAQYQLGARLFDLRVRFDKNGKVVVCHELMEYDCDFHELLDLLDYIDNKGACYVRVVLETTKHDEEQESKFINFCANLLLLFKNINFFGGNNRTDWLCQHPIYRFDTPLPDLDNKYGSATTLFPRGFKWLAYIDDLCPIIYAKLKNRKNIMQGTDHEWLFIDFVDIR